MLRVWTTNVVKIPRSVSYQRLILQVFNTSRWDKIAKHEAPVKQLKSSSVTKIGGTGADGGRGGYQQSGGVGYSSIEGIKEERRDKTRNGDVNTTGLEGPGGTSWGAAWKPDTQCGNSVWRASGSCWEARWALSPGAASFVLTMEAGPVTTGAGLESKGAGRG